MRLLRILGRWIGTALGLAMLAPALALVPAALLDRGPRGGLRGTLFPAALAVLDPFVWECIRNSLAVAVVVALGSLVLGVALASAISRRRFWGRPILTAVALAPLVIPPAAGALGLRVAFGPAGPLQRMADHLAAIIHVEPSWMGWFGLAWVGLAGGAPLVALASARVIGRIEPVWEDVARMAGATRLRIWRELVWPLVRPEAARASGAVFLWTLVEPGAPLVLGLRRTLAFQIVEAAIGGGGGNRAAVLALAALGIAALGRLVLQWWGGPPVAELAETPVTEPERPGPVRITLTALVFGAAGIVMWLPVMGILGEALARPVGGSSSAAQLVPWFGDPSVPRLVANSIALGIGVVGLDLLVGRTAAAWAHRRRPALRLLASWPGSVPPLVLGVGAAVLPGVVMLGGEWLRAVGLPEGLARRFEWLGAWLDLDRNPGVLLLLAVAASRAPLLARAMRSGLRRSRPALADAAISLGASLVDARRLARVGWLGASAGSLALTFALAMTNLTPALVLEPTIESRTILPGLLILSEQPGDGRHRASLLASWAIVLNLTALAIAARGEEDFGGGLRV